MVRTKGLGRILDQVIGRALWREVNCDLDEAFGQWRSTTFARKQREVISIAEDVQHVDHTTNEVQEQPKEVVVDDEVVDVEGFPGGLHDTSVLTGIRNDWRNRFWQEYPNTKSDLYITSAE